MKKFCKYSLNIFMYTCDFICMEVKMILQQNLSQFFVSIYLVFGTYSCCDLCVVREFPSLFSVAVINTLAKIILQRGVYFTFQIIVHHCGEEGQDLKAGTEADTMEVVLSLACSLWFAQLDFLIQFEITCLHIPLPSDTLDLELQIVASPSTWVLGMKLRSTGRRACVLDL